MSCLSHQRNGQSIRAWTSVDMTRNGLCVYTGRSLSSQAQTACEHDECSNLKSPGTALECDK
eukprot:1577250-Rhodomonas_salina.6